MCLTHDGERVKGLPRSRGSLFEVIDGVSCRKVNETTTNGKNGHKERRLSPGVVDCYVGGVGRPHISVPLMSYLHIWRRHCHFFNIQSPDWEEFMQITPGHNNKLIKLKCVLFIPLTAKKNRVHKKRELHCIWTSGRSTSGLKNWLQYSSEGADSSPAGSPPTVTASPSN